MVNLEEKEYNFRLKELVRKSKVIASMSKDSTGVGVVIADKHLRSVLSSGFNMFPIGVKRLGERLNEDDKLLYTVHAEASAITNASRLGVNINDSIMIVHGKCVCNTCAGLIIQSGIRKVYMPKPYETSRWFGLNNIALTMLSEAKIDVVFLDEIDQLGDNNERPKT